VFSAAALVGTAYTKGSQAVVTRVEVIDVLPGTDRWRGHTAIGVFSTRKTWLSLTSGSDDGVMAPLKEPGFMNDIQVISHQGPGQLKYRAETWTLAYARSTWVTPRTGRIRQIQTEDETWIDNALGVDLTHVVLVQPDPSSVGSAADAFQLQDLGPLARGDRAQVHPDAWRLAPPTDELAWAWSHVREMPEAQGGHLHLGSHDRYVLAVAEAPVESVALSGLSPVERNYTVFRIPLGPPKTPSASTWKAEP